MTTKCPRQRRLGPPVLRAQSVALLLAIVGIPVGAQISPNGDQFQVNTVTGSLQGYAGVASVPGSGFVVVWQSSSSGGGDDDLQSIQARRFDARGEPLGDDFQVNTYTTSSQTLPAVASDGGGNFVVVWASLGSGGSDTSGASIQGRRFDASGAPVGDDFQVNSTTSGNQLRPSVAMDPAGRFLVAWSNYGICPADSSGCVEAQLFDAAGLPIGGELQVNSYSTGFQGDPTVAMDAQGNSVIAWTSDGSPGADSSGRSVLARRFDPSGAPLGSEFQVNTLTTNHQQISAVATDPGGGFVVAWVSQVSGGGDDSGYSIQAQRYDATAAPLGGQFQVNTYTSSAQSNPAVAVDSRGHFVIAWESFGSSGSDTSNYSIQAQRFDDDGAPRDAELQVNSYTTNQQRFAAVAADPGGNLVVVWHSQGSNGTDTSGASVQAQRFDDLFRDDFESGDASRWTLAVP